MVNFCLNPSFSIRQKLLLQFQTIGLVSLKTSSKIHFCPTLFRIYDKICIFTDQLNISMSTRSVTFLSVIRSDPWLLDPCPIRSVKNPNGSVRPRINPWSARLYSKLKTCLFWNETISQFVFANPYFILLMLSIIHFNVNSQKHNTIWDMSNHYNFSLLLWSVVAHCQIKWISFE